MPAIVDTEKCNACKSCEEVCPTDSIAVAEQNVAVVKVEECIDCNACMDACSSAAITME
jgi:NAD-dependent dihydropyrimidine dehydrogenase PreA subunit